MRYEGRRRAVKGGGQNGSSCLSPLSTFFLPGPSSRVHYYDSHSSPCASLSSLPSQSSLTSASSLFTSPPSPPLSPSCSPRSRSPSAPLPSSRPPPLPLSPLPSKMDKYFTPTYDPSLDFSLSAMTDPMTGLISEQGGKGMEVGWERMLGVVEARREGKREREVREKEERREERRRKREERERRKGKGKRGRGSDSEEEKEAGPTYDGKKGMMDVKYTKSGGTREWDKGKEQPT